MIKKNPGRTYPGLPLPLMIAEGLPNGLLQKHYPETVKADILIKYLRDLELNTALIPNFITLFLIHDE